MFIFLICIKKSVSFIQPDDSAKNGVEKINGLLESFMGINDNELGER